MNYHETNEMIPQERGADLAARDLRLDRSYVADLIGILARHPSGLRRWSVMRALRKVREGAGREIPQKFEDEVERTFRRFCANSELSKSAERMSETVLFFRPPERAGEVWAVYPDRAETWLKAEHFESER